MKKIQQTAPKPAQPAPAPAQSQSPYFSGSGGPGMRLAVLIPSGGIEVTRLALSGRVSSVVIPDINLPNNEWNPVGLAIVPENLSIKVLSITPK